MDSTNDQTWLRNKNRPVGVPQSAQYALDHKEVMNSTMQRVDEVLNPIKKMVKELQQQTN
jgi:gas vesicle protein